MSFFAHRVKEGEYTKTIYTWIQDGMYKEAIAFLNEQLAINANSKPALSLLAYCHYQLQDWDASITYYQQLVELHPSLVYYKLQLAQSYYQASLFEEALQATLTIEDSSPSGASLADKEALVEISQQKVRLQAAIKYAQGELIAARSLLEQLDDSSPDKAINLASLAYKEGKLDQALQRFHTASQLQSGFQADLAYSIALCHYQKKQYPQALQQLSEIIEKGIKEHPDLGIGVATESGGQVESVGNTSQLQASFLIEAFNLKAAIEFCCGMIEAARDSLTDMPPRTEQELDAVTLHNQALINFELDPVESFEKLQFLLQRPEGAFPPETFSNLLILYCKYDYYELAADLMAENTQFTYKYLSQNVYEFLDGLIAAQTSPEEGYKKFDALLMRTADAIRKLQKRIQNEQGKQQASVTDSETKTEVVKLTEELNQLRQQYVPLLMAQARIYWELEQYDQVEKVFQKSVEFCADQDTWKLNVAHTMFMQNKFKEATAFYEPLVKDHYEKMLEVSAVVLANLCVSYILLGQNEDAQELMGKIEGEEERLLVAQPDTKVYHLCIVNLVIGTLYCSKGNFEFGISRIIKSLEPYDKKLCTDTWFYAKRCFLALLWNLHRQILILKDSAIQECIEFLKNCELAGRTVKAIIETPLESLDPFNTGKNTVTFEARILRLLFMQLTEN